MKMLFSEYRRLAALLELVLSLTPAAAFSWIAPIGIPVPNWPSSLDIERPPLPSQWNKDIIGFYFVQTGGSNAGNGYPANPRNRMPSLPPPGSVIVVNGVVSGSIIVDFSGTDDRPIWIIGYKPESRPTFTNDCLTIGKYLIFDNLNFNGENFSGINLIDKGNHNMYRDCAFRNTYGARNGAGIAAGGSHLIFYRITVYEQGDWQYRGPDIDRHGVKVYAGSDQWFVDSLFFHCQGDGIQVGNANNPPNTINRIYIGRNIAYENLQSGFWTKNATDVIFSQNTVHSIFGGGGGGLGVGMGGQYDPFNVWFLNNRIYHAPSGVFIAGANKGGGGPWYVIGNLIFNIEARDCNAYNWAAMGYRNEGGFFALFNTIHDANMFVAAIPGKNLTIRNNIFSTPKIGSCPNINTQTYPVMDYNAYSSNHFTFGFCGGPSCKGSIQYKTVGEFSAAESKEAHGVVGLLGITNPPTNFELTSNSPCRDKANPAEESVFEIYRSRYGIDIAKDFVGKTRPINSRWDIGAFE
jgi:hypothetical protein